jgi:DNA-binding transcriptional MerR regulator
MKKRLYSTAEVSRLSAIPPHRITYAMSRGRIKEPVRLNGRRAFTERDVAMVKGYFSNQDIYKVRVNGGGNAC